VLAIEIHVFVLVHGRKSNKKTPPDKIPSGVFFALFTKNVLYDFLVSLVLVHEVTFNVDVGDSHVLIHVVEGCMNCVFVNLAFVKSNGSP
jgi:hypothetical protein